MDTIEQTSQCVPLRTDYQAYDRIWQRVSPEQRGVGRHRHRLPWWRDGYGRERRCTVGGDGRRFGQWPASASRGGGGPLLHGY